MNQAKAIPFRVHEDAELYCVDFDDRLDLKLVNKFTKKSSERSYYKLAEGFSIGEVVKIDSIIYFMHGDIDLNLWESKI